ncbi:hypothetical protein OAK24_00015 [Flavobacteriales bacterium]|nr:hypothetical protein [Flavobacteriales bacterium]
MKHILRNIYLGVMIILVVFLSIGFNISKMRCDEDGSLYLGGEVPSCSMDNEVTCATEQEKVSCCMLEVVRLCCPERKDNSCASETETLRFDFETLISTFELNFKEISALFYTVILHDKQCDLKKHINYISGIPPPKLNQPQLAQIQSFLL